MRQKTYLKAKKFSKFRRRASLHHRTFKLKFFTLKRKLEFLPTTSAAILSAVALPIVPKVEFHFEVILYITIFVF